MSEEWLTVLGVAHRYLLGETTVRDRIRRGELPAFRLRGGGKSAPIRIKAEDAEALFERVTAPADAGSLDGKEVPSNGHDHPPTAQRRASRNLRR